MIELVRTSTENRSGANEPSPSAPANTCTAGPATGEPSSERNISTRRPESPLTMRKTLSCATAAG